MRLRLCHVPNSKIRADFGRPIPTRSAAGGVFPAPATPTPFLPGPIRMIARPRAGLRISQQGLVPWRTLVA